MSEIISRTLVINCAAAAIDAASRRGVAIARYEATGGQGAAEVAVAVSSGWRHAGVATELLCVLAEAASEQGIRTFTGSCLAENRPVAALIKDADTRAHQFIEDGIAEFSLPLLHGSADGDAADGRDGADRRPCSRGSKELGSQFWL